MLHRGNYTFRTKYLNGQRTSNMSATAGACLEVLWSLDRSKPKGQFSDRISLNMTSTYQVINIFALFDGLVQALSGAYYSDKAI
jgi:hypothetical protein